MQAVDTMETNMYGHTKTQMDQAMTMYNVRSYTITTTMQNK